MSTRKYGVGDLNNGIVEIFDTKEEAEKALAECLREGELINESLRDKYGIQPPRF